MLIFASDEEEAYYLKLEALWILTNLAMADLEGTMRILASDFDQTMLQNMTKTDL